MRLLCWCSRPVLTWYPLKLHSWNDLMPFNERHELTVHLRVCTSITSTLHLHTPIPAVEESSGLIRCSELTFQVGACMCSCSSAPWAWGR